MFIFTCHFVNAQDIYQNTTIYMYDGSVYKGQVLSEDAFEIELKTDLIGTVLLPKNHVKSRKNGKSIISVAGGKYHKKVGNFFTIDYSLSLGAENYLQQFSFVYGKRITPKINVGIGTSITWANQTRSAFVDQTFVQPHLFGRYYFNDKKWRLFTEMKLGYGIQIQTFQNSSNGVYINPAIGFEIANRKNMKWTLKLSQFIQQTNIRQFRNDFLNNPIIIQSNVWYNRTAFTVGINF